MLCLKYKQNKVTIIILTYNEQIHIKRCIKSVYSIADNIIVIDSFSSDKTLQICKRFKKIKIYQRKFKHQADQMNWALKNLKIKNDWIFRIDADEYLCNFNKNFFLKKLNNKKINGYLITRKIKFLGKTINYGLTSPHKTLRIWRNSKGYYENLSVDEQVVVKGKISSLDYLIIDENLKGFLFWIRKHISYSKREAIEYYKFKKINLKKEDLSKVNKFKKYKIYYKFPIFVRPLLLFIYSYFFKLGFMNGVQGLIFNFFQILIYRFVVDINIFLKKITFSK